MGFFFNGHAKTSLTYFDTLSVSDISFQSKKEKHAVVHSPRGCHIKLQKTGNNEGSMGLVGWLVGWLFFRSKDNNDFYRKCLFFFQS